MIHDILIPALVNGVIGSVGATTALIAFHIIFG